MLDRLCCTIHSSLGLFIRGHFSWSWDPKRVFNLVFDCGDHFINAITHDLLECIYLAEVYHFSDHPIFLLLLYPGDPLQHS